MGVARDGGECPAGERPEEALRLFGGRGPCLGRRRRRLHVPQEHRQLVLDAGERDGPHPRGLAPRAGPRQPRRHGIVSELIGFSQTLNPVKP